MQDVFSDETGPDGTGCSKLVQSKAAELEALVAISAIVQIPSSYFVTFTNHKNYGEH